MKTARSTITQNGNTYSAVITQKAHNYDAGGGRFEEIVTRVEKDIIDPSFRHGVDKIPYTFRGTHRIDGPCMCVEKDGIAVSLYPLNKVNINPDPTSNHIEYDLGALWTGVKWKMQVAPEKVKSLLSLPPGHSSDLVFKVVSNVTPTIKNGVVEFKDDRGVVLSIPAPYVYDGGVDPIVRRVTKAYQSLTRVGPDLLLTIFDIDTSGMSRPILDPTLELQPDASAGLDFFMNENTGIVNYGLDVALNSGDSGGGNLVRSWIKFDYSSIPAGATIVSSSISIYDTDPSWKTVDNNTVNLFDLLAANASLIEGNRNGTNAAVNEPCWNERERLVANWAGSAGCGTAGTDYNATKIASAIVPDASVGFRLFTLNTTGLAAISRAVEDADENYGYLLRADDEATQGAGTAWRSSDYTDDISQRPKSTIVYNIGGTAARKVPTVFWP